MNTNASDVGNLTSMTEQTAANTGAAPDQMLAGAGYCSADNIDQAANYTAERGTEFFIATGRHRRGDQPPVAARGRLPAEATEKQRMSRKLTTKNGRKVYARRKAIVELVFGQMVTLQNARHLLLRGSSRPAANGCCWPPATTYANSTATPAPPGWPGLATS